MPARITTCPVCGGTGRLEDYGTEVNDHDEHSEQAWRWIAGECPGDAGGAETEICPACAGNGEVWEFFSDGRRPEEIFPALTFGLYGR